MIHVNDAQAAGEFEKYTAIWSLDEYRAHSPGLDNVDRFVELIGPAHDQSIIDIGCGEGVAGLKLGELGYRDVTFLDLVSDQLRGDVPRGRFIRSAVWSHWNLVRRIGWDYGYCCDVMEHIPPEYVMLTLDRILSACRTVYFSISFQPDGFGAMIGDVLHLTVRPFTWWRDHLADLGAVVEARDLCGSGIFVVIKL